jgi:hypothetical protein
MSEYIIGQDEGFGDAVLRSAISKEMGFEFDVVIGKRRITVMDRTSPCKAHCRLKNGQVDADTINRLVKACVRLQKAHDEWEDRMLGEELLLEMAVKGGGDAVRQTSQG